MLKTKPLSQLLQQATSPSVTSAFLFTPTGSLLANSASPISSTTKKARTYAALAANIWTAYCQASRSGAIEQCLPKTVEEVSEQAQAQQIQDKGKEEPSNAEEASIDTESGESEQKEESEPLESLTLELSDYNLHIQAVAHRILLCLIGPRNGASHSSSNSSTHSRDDGFDGPGSASSRAGRTGATASTRTGTPASQKQASHAASLGVLKTQAQALAEYLAKELQGFNPPEGI